MSGAVCPSCGVAVVAGYVRCPKCQSPLPRRPAPVVGGTTVLSKRQFPVLPIVGAVVVAVAIIAYFGLRASDPPPAEPAPQPAQAAPVQPPARDPAPIAAPAEPPAAAPTGPTAQQVASDLERDLKRQRLWSTVRVIGDRADVRSGACEDPAMASALDGAAPALKAAGLTTLRCLEQSGRVVTARDL